MIGDDPEARCKLQICSACVELGDKKQVVHSRRFVSEIRAQHGVCIYPVWVEVCCVSTVPPQSDRRLLGREPGPGLECAAGGRQPYLCIRSKNTKYRMQYGRTCRTALLGVDHTRIFTFVIGVIGLEILYI